MNDKEKQLAIYLYGRLEVQLEGLARSPEVSQSNLALGLAELLLGSQGRSLLGNSTSVSTLPRNSGNAGVQRKVRAKPPVHVRTRRNVRIQEKEAKVVVKQVRKHLHWTQTAKGKAFMKRRMRKFWREGRFKGKMAKAKKKEPAEKRAPDFYDPSTDLTK